MSQNPNHFDVAIIGGGLAGLSAAYHLGEAGYLDNHRVALIDPERKSGHDRSWSYWAKGEDDFDHLVHSKWSRIVVANQEKFLDLEMSPYAYKHIQSSDFYKFMNAYLDKQRNLIRIFGIAEDVSAHPGGFTVRAGLAPIPPVSHPRAPSASQDASASTPDPAGTSPTPPAPASAPKKTSEITATYLLDSRPKPVSYQETSAPYLDQHFRGWFIRTRTPIFDTERAHIMDFRLPQRGECRFVYVLPSSPSEAMIEFTAFSNNHLSEEAYAKEMENYLAEHWTTDYEIVGREGGNIPMTTHPFPVREGNHIYIGLGGGAARPSSGYTFYALQRQLKALAAKFPTSEVIAPWPKRHLYYDATILRILQDGLIAGSDVFVDLFEKNPPARVLDFLNGETSMPQEIALMNSTHIPTFGAAFIKEAVKKVF